MGAGMKSDIRFLAAYAACLFLAGLVGALWAITQARLGWLQ